MKSSAPTAVALTLIMFLIVLASAVFFLVQGQQSLKGELQSANDDVRTLEKQQAQIELNNSAAQATLDTLELSGTSTSAENVGLTEQLANSDQLIATLEAQEVQLNSDLENANATMEILESQAPLVTVVGPQDAAVVSVGQPVELVIVASDHAGVNSVLFNIGNDLLGGPIEEVGVTAIMRHSWTPTDADEGPITIFITATNVNGITSEPSTIDLTVVAVATSTPEPTVEAIPEATPEN
jgi:hypothetical protein